VAALLAGVAAACGGSTAGKGAATPSPSASGMTGMTGMTEETSFDFGQSGDPAKANRTIDITATDALTFEPVSVTVKMSETVTFRVRNAGQTVHEFMLGDEQAQMDHEREMQQMAKLTPAAEMMDELNMIFIMPGETKEITWTFTKAGQLEYGCHEPGHYPAGMLGEITVS